jgi:hypothetical protein
MRFEEYRKHDAVSLAELIAKRRVSAAEVLETAIARAEQVNPAINAVVHKQYEQARKAVAAGLAEGPLVSGRGRLWGNLRPYAASNRAMKPESMWDGHGRSQRRRENLGRIPFKRLKIFNAFKEPCAKLDWYPSPRHYFAAEP